MGLRRFLRIDPADGLPLEVMAALSLISGTVSGATLPAPTATNTAAAGAAPEVDITWTGDVFAGYYLRIERSASSAKDVDGGFTTPTLDILHQITESEVTADAITNANLAGDGYANPTGTWYQQYRFEREDGAVSAWSNTLTGTVTSSVATLATVTGVNKNSIITVSGTPALNALSTDWPNAPTWVRTLTTVTGKRQFEATITSMSSGGTPNGTVGIGVANIGEDLSGNPNIGEGVPGVSMRVKRGSTDCFVKANASFVIATSLAAAPVVGDKLGMRFDTATNAIEFYFIPLATGTLLVTATFTLSSYIPTTWAAVLGFFTNGDGASINFGASAFGRALDNGYSNYG